MHIIKLKGATKYADEIIMERLVDLADLTPDAQARACLARLSRSYSHAIIDGIDYILIPHQQSPIEKADAA